MKNTREQIEFLLSNNMEVNIHNENYDVKNDRGNLIVDKDAIQMMNSNSNQQIVQVEFDTTVSKTELKSIKGVEKVKQLEGDSWQLTSTKSEDLRVEISKFASSKGILVLSLQKETQKLENIFKELTH